MHDASTPDQVIERMAGAEVMLVNKVRISEQHFAALPTLKVILVSATGTDNGQSGCRVAWRDGLQWDRVWHPQRGSAHDDADAEFGHSL